VGSFALATAVEETLSASIQFASLQSAKMGLIFLTLQSLVDTLNVSLNP
jgi:hypothetical protein